jgi:hypothetical protein
MILTLSGGFGGKIYIFFLKKFKKYMYFKQNLQLFPIRRAVETFLALSPSPVNRDFSFI